MSDTKPAPMRGLNVIDFRPLVKGSLIGFMSFSYGHVTINSAPVMQSGGRTWIALPGKQRFNHDGSPLLSAKGKPVYEPLCLWTTREGGDKVQAQLLDQLAEMFPAALAGGQ